MSLKMFCRLLPENLSLLIFVICIALAASSPVPTDTRGNNDISPPAIVIPTSTILKSSDENFPRRTKRLIFNKMLVELIIRDREKSESTTHEPESTSHATISYPYASLPRLPIYLG